MNLKQAFRRLVRSRGYDICGFTPSSHPVARRKWILDTNGVDTVLDVGANIGQYGQHLRRDVGYTGRIVSFEPLSREFARLRETATQDDRWEVFNLALGDRDGPERINIAGNSFSSSLLPMLKAHETAAPGSGYVGTETIEVRTLDSLFAELVPRKSHVYLKMDTQGFESKVLAGAKAALAHIDVVQMEMAIVPLYEGEERFHGLHDHMGRLGFDLIALEPAFFDADSGRLLQVDGVFQRSSGRRSG